MKTSYCLTAAAVLAAVAVAVHAQLPPVPPPATVPAIPLVPPPDAKPPAVDPLALPPIVPDPTSPPPVKTPVADAPSSPALPVPAVSAPGPAPLPLVPPPVLPPAPAPTVSAPPSLPAASPPPALPSAPPPSSTPPATTLLPPPTAIPPSGQVVILKDDKLVEGTVTVAGEKVIVRQGVVDRTFKKDEVQHVANSKDEAYRFQLGKLKADDAAARLKLAKWCMFNGMRPQALAEAREVAKLQPTNTAATELARSLEESLRQFPGDGTTPAFPLGTTNPSLATDPTPDVTAEAASVFAARVQPVLSNLCSDCHARAEYAGSFKLARTTGYDATPSTTRHNLTAVVAQLKKAEPANSPLLVKALAMHGNMKEPAIATRQAPSYRALEGWVSVALGCPPAPTATIPPVKPALPPADPVKPVLPVAPPPALTAPPVALPGPAVKLPVAPPPPIPKLAEPIPPAKESPQFGQDAPPLPKASGPSPTNPGPAVDEFDPSVFNRTATPGKK